MSTNTRNLATTKVVINFTTFHVPNYYVCPITGQVMVHPLKTPSGLHFEETAILSWLKHSETCPLTLKPLTLSALIPSKNLETEIRNWRKVNGLHLDRNNHKDFKQIEKDISTYFLSLESKEEVEIVELLSPEEMGTLDLTCSPKIVSPVDNKRVRRKGARWNMNILRLKKTCYAPLSARK
jgi:hypothetical protein